MPGIPPTWDVDTPEGLERAATWLRAHLALFKEGAIWMIPRSASIIRIEPSKRRATRIAGIMPETSTEKVLKALGWEYVDEAGD